MHILTKLLVVIAAVLSVALSALTISYAANVDRVVGDYNSANDRMLSAKDALQTAEHQLDTRTEELEMQLQQVRGEMANREAELRRMQSKNVLLIADKRSAETARSSIENRIAQLGEASVAQLALIESYRTEVTTLRVNELRFRNEKLELEDRISDLESQREVVLATNRSLQEQLQAFKLGGVDGEGVASAGVIEYQGAPIQGEVLEISNDVSGREVARIDLGSNDNMRENLKLYVYRGTTFLANMVILETDLNTSIGEINDLGRNMQIRPGDRVVTRLR